MSFFVKGYVGEKCGLVSGTQGSFIDVILHNDTDLVISVAGEFKVNVTKIEKWKTSKYPDLYDKRTSFSGDAVIYTNKFNKKHLALDANEYVSVTGSLFQSFDQDYLGIEIYYTSGDKPLSRYIGKVKTEELSKYIFKIFKDRLQKTGCKIQ